MGADGREGYRFIWGAMHPGVDPHRPQGRRATARRSWGTRRREQPPHPDRAVVNHRAACGRSPVGLGWAARGHRYWRGLAGGGPQGVLPESSAELPARHAGCRRTPEGIACPTRRGPGANARARASATCTGHPHHRGEHRRAGIARAPQRLGTLSVTPLQFWIDGQVLTPDIVPCALHEL